MRADDPDPDPDWEHIDKMLTAISERMMRAGWVTESFHDSGGFGIHYTDGGLQKLQQMWQLLAELDVESMSPDDLNGLRTLLMLGWRDGKWS